MPHMGISSNWLFTAGKEEVELTLKGSSTSNLASCPEILLEPSLPENVKTVGGLVVCDLGETDHPSL